MPSVSFVNIIKPKLKTVNAESPFGMFHDILANSLSEWFNLILPLQNGTATGTVITPAGVSFPFTYPLMKANILKIYFNSVLIKGCAAGTGEEFFPNLFNYIGLIITQQLGSWTSSPPSMNTSNPIYLTGIASPLPITTHFYNIGLSYKYLLKIKQPTDPDLFDYTWSQFEQKLKFAINTIPPLWMPITGITPAGNFTGFCTAKFTV